MEKKETKEVKETKSKFDFKKETKATWNAFVRFIKPFRNLDNDVLLPKTEGFLQKHIQMIYYVGCVVLGLFAFAALWRLPAIFSVLGQWIIVMFVFVIFRTLCEMVAKEPKAKK